MGSLRMQIQTYLVPDSPLFAELAKAQDSAINSAFLLLLLLNALLVGVCTLIVSHRVAGPLYKLRKEMRKLAESKKFSPIAFRERDFFKEIATDYNEALKEFASSKQLPVAEASTESTVSSDKSEL
jgi:hypothetical protein